jgi:hypothetical protein
MQSVPFSTNIVSSNPAQASCTRYNIMWWSLSVICDRSVVFSGYSCFLHQLNWLPRYTSNWNIVESGVKHHNLPLKILQNIINMTFSQVRNHGKLWDLSINITNWFFNNSNYSRKVSCTLLKIRYLRLSLDVSKSDSTYIYPLQHWYNGDWYWFLQFKGLTVTIQIT